MEQPALRILQAHRIMAISTLRPDGWPQTTIVGYANRGFELFFLIYRASQKFANIQLDDRISIAIGAEPREMEQIAAVYAAAHAQEITEEIERQKAWRLLMERHSNLAGFQIPDASEAVFMRAACKYISVLDFSQGLGHREQLAINDQGAPEAIDVRKDSWGVAVAGVDADSSDRASCS